MTLRERQQVFSRTMGLFLSWMAHQGYNWTMGDTWRGTDELLCPHCGTGVSYQDLLYYNGRSKVRNSKHNDRMAMDINLFTKDGKMAQGEDYRPLAEKWESLGGRAGFRFGLEINEYKDKVGFDPGHFEL